MSESRPVVVGRAGVEERAGWRRTYKGTWENLDVMDLFTVLIVVMVSHVHTYDKT